MTPLSELEQQLAKKLITARFPPYSASKRFARDLADGYVKQLSHNGRIFFAFVLNRFRRQYKLNPEEIEWVAYWLHQEREVPAKPAKQPAQRVPPRQSAALSKLEQWEQIYGKRTESVA